MKNPIKRSIGPFELLLTGVSSIVGSTWLFGSLNAAKTAGPAAILSWVIGALIIIPIGLTYVELGAMFPESGGMVRYARYSHGSFVGFISAWTNWISIVSVIPFEAAASVQYMASWPYAWAHGLFSQGQLTTHGLLASSALVVVYFLLNYWGVKLFVKSNSLITVFKIVVPILTAGGLIWSGFHPENLPLREMQRLAPYGWSAVLTAIATGGIVLSYNGFQSPVNFAGEARDPHRSIPFAVVGGILVTLVLYVILQTAFIGAVAPSSIARGWHGLNFTSPFAQLAFAINLNWLVILLYLDAFISPSGTGATFTATTARMIQAMERNNTMPRILGEIHPLYGVPRYAMWFNLAVAFTFLYFFRGWGALASVISVAVILSYVTGPTSVMALRRYAPNYHRPLRIAGMAVIAPFAFICASLLLYWARWPLTGQFILLTVVGLPIYFFYQSRAGWHEFAKEMRSTWWLAFYLPSMAALSFIGGKSFGGLGWIDNGWDFGAVSLIALFFYFWGVSSGRLTTYLSEAEAPAGSISKDTDGASRPTSAAGGASTAFGEA